MIGQVNVMGGLACEKGAVREGKKISYAYQKIPGSQGGSSAGEGSPERDPSPVAVSP